MSTVRVDFRDRQVAVGAWDGQTAHQAGATFRLFIEVCGDRGTGTYTRRDSGQYRSMVERLPSDYGKAALFRDLLVSDIVQCYEALPPDARSSLNYAEDGKAPLLRSVYILDRSRRQK